MQFEMQDGGGNKYLVADVADLGSVKVNTLPNDVKKWVVRSETKHDQVGIHPVQTMHRVGIVTLSEQNKMLNRHSK